MRSKFKWIFTLLLALSMQFSFAQEKTVTGVVSDATGPIPGVNVVVKGTTRGTQTDVDGKYSISAKQGETLVFSFIGMGDQSKQVGASNSMNVKLSEGAQQLSEVVVTGALGIKKRVDQQTSTTTVVKAKELTQAGAPSVVQGLVGKVSGLQISTTSNGVNSSSRIVINGVRSISGNNQALVIIDNVKSNATVLNSIAPEIVENVTVLKGAQGAALYGEDGVNGVIIVTTRKGSSEGKITVDVNASVDFQEISYLPERQTRYGQGWNGEHIAIENGSWGAEMNGSMQPVGLPQADGSFMMSPYSPIKDNIGQFFQTGTILQKGVTVSGGNAKDGYALLSASRQDREFVVKGDELFRTNVLFKAGKQLGKLFMEGNVQYYNQGQKNTTAGLYAQLLQTASNIPVGQFENSGNNHHWTVYYRSPSWTRDNVRAENTTDFVSGTSTLKYDFNKNISASWVANVQLSTVAGMTYTNAFTKEEDIYSDYTKRFVISNYFSSTSSARRINSDFLVNFDYMLTDDISFVANVGNNVQDVYTRINQVGGSNLDVDGWYNNGNVLEPSLASGLNNNYSRFRKFSYMGSADFGYKKYLNLNVTGRNDWTSTFSKENRSFFYPSAGLSFVPTKAFEGMKSDVLNYAKLMLSWSKVGNSSTVGAYDIDETGVSAAGFPFGTLSSYVTNANPTDKGIKPEFVTTLDFGASFGFFKDRLTLEAQYTNQETKDLITSATASSASGLSSSTTNIGALETKGYNIDLGFTPIKGAFTWEGRINLSHTKTIVTKVSAGADEVSLYNDGSTIGIFAVVGEEFPSIKGIGYVRDDAGNVVIDQNTGNPLKTSQFINLGTAAPDYTLGFSNSVSYKGFKLSAVCDYRSGGKFYSEVKSQLAWTGNLIESAENGRSGGFIYPNSVYESAPGVYTENTNIVTGGSSYADYQKYFSDEYGQTGENFVLDASAFKVRELALSYSFPKTFIEKAGISALTFGVNARNPFMVLPKSNRNYADPETSNNAGPNGNGQGIANIGAYPNTRTFGFLINAKF